MTDKRAFKILTPVEEAKVRAVGLDPDWTQDEWREHMITSAQGIIETATRNREGAERDAGRATSPVTRALFAVERADCDLFIALAQKQIADLGLFREIEERGDDE